MKKEKSRFLPVGTVRTVGRGGGGGEGGEDIKKILLSGRADIRQLLNAKLCTPIWQVSSEIFL